MKEIELIRSIPGIGLVTGLTFLSGDMKIMNDSQIQDKLAWFCRTNPLTCHFSGEVENIGRDYI